MAEFFLDVKRAACLSLSSTGDPGIVFVSEHAFLHREGNSIQLSSVPISKQLDRTAPLSERISEISDIESQKADPSVSGFRALWSQFGHGFSCYTFSSRQSRVAYVPRNVNPDIIVESFPAQERLWVLSGGAAVDYSDVSFNKDGTRLAGLGKGDVDRKIWIWKLIDDAEQPPQLQQDEGRAWELMIAIDLDRPGSTCEFNPLHSDEVAILALDGSQVSVLKIRRIVGNTGVDRTHLCPPMLKKDTVNYNLSEDADLSEPSKCTAFAWEQSGKIVVGSSSGAIFVFDGHQVKPSSVIHSNCPSSEIVGLIVTMDSVIIGFENGTMQWRRRLDGSETSLELQWERCLPTGILCLACNPEFNQVTVICQDGCLYRTDVERKESPALNDHTVTPGVTVSIHAGAITSITPVLLSGKAAYTIMVSGGSDGTVKGWKDSVLTSSTTKMGMPVKSSLFSLDLGPPITCLATLVGFPVVAVGSADGYVRFIHAGRNVESIGMVAPDNTTQVTVIKAEQLSSAPVTSMSFNQASRRLAVGCYSTGSVFIVNTDTRYLNVVGLARTADRQPLASMIWDQAKTSCLIIGSVKGVLSCIDTAAMDGSCRTVASKWTHRMEIDTDLLTLSQAATDTRLFYSSWKDFKGVACFSVPDSDEGCSEATVECLSKSHGGTTDCSSLTVSLKNDIIVGGTCTGEVAIFRNHRHGGVRLHSTTALHAAPILTVALSADGMRLYSSGADGSLMVCNLVGTNGYQPTLSCNEFDILASNIAQSKASNPCSPATNGTSWIEAAQARLKEQRTMDAKNDKEAIACNVRQLSKKLACIVRENEGRKEIEQLDRHELVIDVGSKEKFTADTEKKCDELRTSIHEEATEKAMESVRIRQVYWDSMSFHGCQIKAIDPKSSSCLTNFPMRKTTVSEERTLNIIKYLRRMEINDLRRNPNRSSKTGLCWSGFLHESANLKPVFGPQSEAPNRDVIVVTASSDVADEDSRVDDPNTEYDMFDKFIEVDEDCNLRLLLYPSLAVCTEAQRRSQIVLLKALIREFANEFNQRFNRLREEKEAMLSSIEARNERIEEILKALERVETVAKPSMADCEIPESVLLVRDNEMTTTPYETRKERELREKVEQEQVKDALASKEDDAPRRALEDMMNGTLEVKQKVLAKNPIKKKAWMDELSCEDMSAEQKREFDEYEKYRIEFERSRTALEVELKKLRSEVENIVQSFDDKLDRMISERVAVQSTIATHELYFAQLANNIMRREAVIMSVLEMDRELRQMKNQSEKTSAISTKLQAEQDRLKEELSKASEEDTALAKSFRRNIQKTSSDPLDQDTVKMLLHLYRKRKLLENDTLGIPNKVYGSRMSKMNKSEKDSVYNRRSNIGRSSGRERHSSKALRRNSVVSARASDGGGGTSVDAHSKGTFHVAMSEGQRVVEEGYFPANDPFSDMGDAASPVDASDDADLSKNVGSIENARPLLPHHIPEGFTVSKDVWEALQNLRSEKIRQEKAVDVATKRWIKAKQQCDRAKEKESLIASEIALMERKRDKMEHYAVTSMKDPDVLVWLKQGQDEIDKEAVVTNYADGILIPLHMIEATNAEITKLGEDQVKFLNRTKNFRRKINYMHWNSEYLEMKERDLNEQYIDFQLLRVTKQLKVVLSGEEGNEISERAKAYRAEEQAAMKQKNHEARLYKLEQESASLKKRVDDRNAENTKLMAQLEQLKESVRIREETQANKLGAKGSLKEQQQQEKMKRIAKRRKLGNIVRSQAEEMDKLRRELDRLRQRTIPNFTNAASYRMRPKANPDARV